MFGFRGWKGGRRGWLRPWVLSIVSKSPKNGAEIMDDIEQMSWGGWRPSPGSIYPLLEDLTTEGLILKREDGKYEITEKGKAESDWSFGMPFGHHPHGVDQMLSEINGYVSYFEDLARSDKVKFAKYQTSIREISARLSKLSE